MATHHAPIEEHPDLMELRARHDRAAITQHAQMIEALALITGLYLAASPWIVGFDGFTTLAVTNLIAGIAYMLLLGGLGSSYERTHSIAWAAAAIGIWTCVRPLRVVAGDVATPAPSPATSSRAPSPRSSPSPPPPPPATTPTTAAAAPATTTTAAPGPRGAKTADPSRLAVPGARRR